MRRSTRIDGSAGGEPLSCGTQSTYNRVANAGNLHRLSPFQMPFGILHNLTGKSSLTFSIEKCHFITAISMSATTATSGNGTARTWRRASRCATSTTTICLTALSSAASASSGPARRGYAGRGERMCAE